MIINFDLINILISISAILSSLLGILLIIHKRDSVNYSFFSLTLSILLWSLMMIIYRSSTNTEVVFFFSRLLYFFALGVPISFFFLASYFPDNKYFFGRYIFWSIISGGLGIGLISLVPKFLIYGVIQSTGSEKIILFNLQMKVFYITFIIYCFMLAYYALYKKYQKSIEIKEKKQFLQITLWTIISATMGLITNLFLPTFQITSLNWLAQISSLLMIGGIAYAIIKHRLFNIKVATTEFFAALLWIFILIRAFLSDSLIETSINLGLFVATVIFGFLLIRSVLQEVSQREHIEKLAGDLAKTNDQLKFANEKLKKLDQQKTEFVSIASHQLRSPLTAIKGYSSMLLEGSFGALDSKAKEAVDIIFQSSQKLVSVIEDFLNVTRIELGRMRYEISLFDLEQLVKTIIKDQEPTITKRGLSLNLESSPDPHLISADSGKITQVISNIIDNSLKYTPQGWIKIKIENVSVGRSKNKKNVRLSITDSGVGIAPETLPKLFDKFVRADDAGKTNISGTGLGLYVAKQMVEGLGGKIWAESEGKGKGSTFFVEFPKSKSLVTSPKDSKIESYTKKDFDKFKKK